MTEYGKSVQATITSFDTDEKYLDYINESSTDSFDYDHYMKWEADTKEARLRRNIKYVLDTKIGEQKSAIKDIYLLQDEIVRALDDMSDFELINYSREHTKELQLFFEYKTYINNDYSELDARTLKLLEGLGIDIDEHIQTMNVPDKVVQKLIKLDAKLRLEDVKFDE